MIFIGIALLIAFGLALLIVSDAGSVAGLSQTQTGQLIPLILILVLVAGGVFSRRRRLGELLAGLVLWAGIFGVVLIGYTYRYELSHLGSRVLAELSPGAAVVDTTSGTATIWRSLGGSFHVNAEINGAGTRMIFDTGASAVVLTQTDARAAGIDPDGLRYTIPVQTANGTGQAAQVVLESVAVGGITRRNIRAFVAQRDALETSLLGMSYLETLSGFAVDRDSLTLKD